jgi:hypothetical protein
MRGARGEEHAGDAHHDQEKRTQGKHGRTGGHCDGEPIIARRLMTSCPSLL